MDSFIAARLVGPKRARRDGLEISLRRVVARLTGPFRRLGNRSPNAGSPFRRLGTHFRKSACVFRHLGNHFRKSACAFRHLGNHFRIPFELSDISETISGFRLSFPTSRKPFPEVRSSFPTSRKPAPAAGMSSRSWKQEKCPLP